MTILLVLHTYFVYRDDTMYRYNRDPSGSSPSRKEWVVHIQVGWLRTEWVTVHIQVGWGEAQSHPGLPTCSPLLPVCLVSSWLAPAKSSTLQPILAHIQAGAGVVADSVPEKEYEETVNKAAALGRAVDLAEQAFGA